MQGKGAAMTLRDGIYDEVLVSAALCDTFSGGLELQMFIEDGLEESPMAFVRVGDEWVGCGHRIGCGYAEIHVSQRCDLRWQNGPGSKGGLDYAVWARFM